MTFFAEEIRAIIMIKVTSTQSLSKILDPDHISDKKKKS